MTNFKVELLLPEGIAVACLNAVKKQAKEEISRNLFFAYDENKMTDVEKMVSYLSVVKQSEDLISQINEALSSEKSEVTTEEVKDATE